MAKREWGAKHTCADCGVKFYDLHRRPIACPKCDAAIEVETVRPNRRRPAAESVGTVGEAPAVAEEDALVEDANGDDDGLVEDIDEAEPTRPSAK